MSDVVGRRHLYIVLYIYFLEHHSNNIEAASARRTEQRQKAMNKAHKGHACTTTCAQYLKLKQK